jgi:hypothetical protein
MMFSPVWIVNPKAYVETSIISYLAALPSRDLLVAAHQQVTRDWWARRDALDIYVSQLVVDEATAGDPAAVVRRLGLLTGIALLDLTPEAARLARDLLDGNALPAKARVDALHVAVATVHGMEYLVTWNCVHIANATNRARIAAVCATAGFEPPIICTPLELAED